MKLIGILVICLLLFSQASHSQTKVAKFMQFNNFSATFEVPEGKTWVISQIFSSFSAGVKKNEVGQNVEVPVRIFIKTLNGDIKTDYAGNRFGPQVFQSNNTSATIAYPIVFPEKTKFSLVLVKGILGNLSGFDGTGYISFYEVTNR